MFRAYSLIIKRSKLHYTASGIHHTEFSVKQKFCASSWLITEINMPEKHGQKNVKKKLFLCLMSKLWFSLFVRKRLLFWTTNINKDNIYCELNWKGPINCNIPPRIQIALWWPILQSTHHNYQYTLCNKAKTVGSIWKTLDRLFCNISRQLQLRTA